MSEPSEREASGAGAGRRKLTLGTRVLIGFLLGGACGVFFGELCGPLELVGETYVGLLQMTVLPYVAVSLTTRIGRLTLAGARRLGRHSLILLVAFWGMALVAVLAFAQGLPGWDAGSFFSPTALERPEMPDLVALYVPTNIFESLANNVVPAVVLFSICMGVALIALPEKERVLAPLEVGTEALGRVTNFVVALSPIGTFALTAHGAGTQSGRELVQMQAYVVLYTVAILFLTLVALPSLVASTTPVRYRHIFGAFRPIGLTVFAIGKLFAVLTMVIDRAENLLVRQGVPPDKARASADVYVPLAYSFPNAGKLLTLLFIPFCAWFVGTPLEAGDYPLLLSLGALSLFGSPVVAIPFMLHMLHLPMDLFPLFLISAIWCARMGDLAGAMHLLCFTLMGSAASAGQVSVKPARIGLWVVGTGVAGVLCVAGVRTVLRWTVGGQEPMASRVLDVEFEYRYADMIERSDGDASDAGEVEPGRSHIDRIRSVGILRVGYEPDTPPFCYRSDEQELVGFDIDLMQRFAGEFGAALELVPVHWDEIADGFAEDRFDLAVGGIPSSLEHYGRYEESKPYLETHLAMVARDYRVHEFRTVEMILSRTDLRVGITPAEARGVRYQVEFPELQLEPLLSDLEYLSGTRPDIDALVTSAEVGSVYSMLYPEYAVVIPKGAVKSFPLIVGIRADAPELTRYLDTWIDLRRADGLVDRLYDWILGERPEKVTRRWSVVKDVLGWVD